MCTFRCTVELSSPGVHFSLIVGVSYFIIKVIMCSLGFLHSLALLAFFFLLPFISLGLLFVAISEVSFIAFSPALPEDRVILFCHVLFLGSFILSAHCISWGRVSHSSDTIFVSKFLRVMCLQRVKSYFCSVCACACVPRGSIGRKGNLKGCC